MKKPSERKFWGAVAGALLLGCAGAPMEEQPGVEQHPPEAQVPEAQAPEEGREEPWVQGPGMEVTASETSYVFSQAQPTPLGVVPANFYVQGGPGSATTYLYNLGTNSGLFTFRYHHGATPDRVQVKYRDIITFDTGCVGTFTTPYAPPTASIAYAGDSSEMKVVVTPRCNGGNDGTAWQFWADIPAAQGLTCGDTCPAGARVQSRVCSSSCPGACDALTPNAVTCGDISLTLNSGFEFGQTGWMMQTSATSGASYTVQSDVVRHGGQAARLAHGVDGTWGTVLWQLFSDSVRASERYELRAWVKGAAGGEPGDLHLQSDSSWTVSKCIDLRAEAGWRQYGCTLRIPSSFDLHKVRAGIRVLANPTSSPPSALYVDGLEIRKLTHDNLLNGGFEEDFVGWTLADQSRPALELRTTPTARQGVQALAVTTNGTGLSSVVQRVPPAPVGASYTLRTWVRTAAGTGSVELVVRDLDAFTTIGGKLVAVTDTAWTEVALPVTIPSTAAGHNLRLELRNPNASNTLLFDAVSFSSP